MKLNLGEGNFPLSGYVGIDRKNGGEVYPLLYPDSSVAEVRASHVLEHFSHRQVQDVIDDWVRVLEPGGVLKIAVPDFARIVQWYQERRKDKPLQGYLVGGQVDDNDYHKSVFDAMHLTACLQRAGLSDIKPWRSDIEDNASWEVSLNLQGTKLAPIPWSVSAAYNKYSQYGEDGILEVVFENIGIENHYCVDVGAADGLLFSNVRQFIEQGWSGLLIESDPERFKKLSQDSGGQFGKGQVRCFNYMVEPTGLHSLDNLLEKAGAPAEFDLLSIDIDGQDYYIWNSLLRFSPRVVVVEYDPEAESMFIPPLGGKGQAGWNAMTYVAAARGYQCIAQTQTNLICLRRDIIEATGMRSVREDAIIPAADSYDGDAQRRGHGDALNDAVAPVERAATVLPAAITSNHIPTAMDGSSLHQADVQTPVKIIAVMSVPRLGFNDNWHSTIRALLALQIHTEMVTGVFWHQCITRGIEKAIAQGAEVILTIDYDTVFDVQHVVKLCQLLADNPNYDAIVPVQVKRECDQLLFKMNGSRDFSQSLTPIAAGHFGLTVIDVKAFARMPKPWFIDVPSPNGDWNDGRVDSDMKFWEQFTAAGLKIGLANEVRIGHLELMVTWANKEFQIVRQSVSDYREKGQPIECGGDLKTELAI